MSGLIDSLKSVRKVDREVAAHDKKLSAHVAALDRATAQHQQAVEAWKARIQAQFDEGKVSDEREPSRPETLRLADGHLARLRHEREGLNRSRLEAISDAGPQVLDAASSAVAQILEAAKPLVAALDECLEALRDAQRDVELVADATNAVSSKGTIKSPDRPTVDLTALAVAVRTGGDPLEGHRQHAQRVLGFLVEKEGPDGVIRSEPVSAKVDPEAERLRTAAYAAQARGILGRAAPRPLGYRSGLV